VPALAADARNVRTSVRNLKFNSRLKFALQTNIIGEP
jgi:hypothetical protein